MADVKLYFLDEEYTVPSELREFVGYLNDFDEIRNEVMSLLTSQMKLQKYTGGADEDFVYFKTPLTKIGQKVIAMLSQKSIFDVTLDDVVYQNPGYIQLHTVCQETIQGMANILLNAMQDWKAGYENAYSSAASNITGSGVSIWTNSLSSALIYSAMEASTLKKQANKADKEYSMAMTLLSKRIDDSQKQQERNLLVNKYYPCAAEALNRFVSELMEFYISKLEQHGIFAYSLIKQYNLQRSTGILDNLGLVADKKGILKQAFICCPYNPDIYKAALDNGFADLRTFETAKYFMQDGILLEGVEEYCQQNYENRDKIAEVVKILALFIGADESQAWNVLEADKKKREDKERAESERRQRMQNDLQRELDRKLAEIDNQQKPAAPTYFGVLLSKEQHGGMFILWSLLGVLCLLFCALLHTGGILIVIGIVGLVVGISSLFSASGAYEKAREKYEGWDREQADKKAQLRKQYREYAHNISEYGKREKP